MTAFLDMLERCPVLPAPMCNISCRATREIARDHGAHLVYTQMVSSEGLIRNDPHSLDILDIEGEEPPVAVQLFGSNPDNVAGAARMLEERGATVVDFNMGCPARKVIGSNCGAALLRDPRLAGAIVRAAARAISAPFTVKMRWDWDEAGEAALEVARICEGEGAQAVCLHARSREAHYSGRALWDRIALLKEAVRIPVIGNGDIRSGQDAVAMMRATGCDAVMIGRGVMGNPWLIADCVEAVRAYRNGGANAPGKNDDSALPRRGPLDGHGDRAILARSTMERIAMMRRHARRMAECKGEARGLKEFRKHAVNYVKGLHDARHLKSAMMSVRTTAELDAAIVAFLTEQEQAAV